MQVQVYRNPLEEEVEEAGIEFDYYYAALPGALVFVFLWVYMCSLCLTIFSVILIAASYPPAILIYRGLFEITFSSYTTYISLLILIPVATHNVFIFAEGWEYSARASKNKNIRMA